VVDSEASEVVVEASDVVVVEASVVVLSVVSAAGSPWRFTLIGQFSPSLRAELLGWASEVVVDASVVVVLSAVVLSVVSAAGSPWRRLLLLKAVPLFAMAIALPCWVFPPPPPLPAIS